MSRSVRRARRTPKRNSDYNVGDIVEVSIALALDDAMRDWLSQEECVTVMLFVLKGNMSVSFVNSLLINCLILFCRSNGMGLSSKADWHSS